MYFVINLIIASVFLATATCKLVPEKRAVFSTTTYDKLSISGGVAGNAEAEAREKLRGLPENLSTVEKEDVKFLNSVNQMANKAEKEAFNPTIEAASEADAGALRNGKIKNKVLKLMATVLKLKAQEAQGKNVAEKLAIEQKKLANNINTDKKHAGEPSTAVNFDASTS